MTKIGIILGSTRPGRNGEAVARWVLDIASKRTDAEFELIDLLDYKLPHLDEQLPPSMGQYSQPHTQEWARKIAGFDGFIFVTPEYNHSTSGVLKNAIDYLYAEWNNKAAGFVSYGAMGGARAVEHLRLIAGDVEPALLAPGAHDRVLSQYASDLRDAVAAFAAAPDCPARTQAVTKIGHACDACHRDYK
jgi:NAD(P)H-dependent FMN reductase